MAICIYIKDGHKKDGSIVDFIGAILDGVKTGETRSHKHLTRKWVGIAKNGYVYGKVLLSDPIPLRKGTPEYFNSLIEGTEYDISENETRYFYPVAACVDFRNDPKPIISNGNYGKYEE